MEAISLPFTPLAASVSEYLMGRMGPGWMGTPTVTAMRWWWCHLRTSSPPPTKK